MSKKSFVEVTRKVVDEFIRRPWYSNTPKQTDLFEEKRRKALEVYNNGYPNIELRKDRAGNERPPNCS